MKNSIIRQGDVLLVPVNVIPSDCKEVPLHNGAIVLAFGEQTGHTHAIRDAIPASWSDAKRIAENAIGLAGRRARLLEATNGARYLEVAESVNLTHEEHTAHEIPTGFYEIPVQVEHTADKVVRQVQD